MAAVADAGPSLASAPQLRAGLAFPSTPQSGLDGGAALIYTSWE